MTEDGEKLQRLLEKVYRERGFDFREYKDTTLTRRLARRLRARGAETYATYAQVLDQDPAEYDRLFSDLTIKVTGFFRDDVAFHALEEVVLPALVSSQGKEIRIWSAGCATGEEPYSIAMLLLEILGEGIERWNVNIWGTDIDEKVLDCAREGWFAPKGVAGVRPDRLGTYFIPERGGFRIRPLLGQLVSFEMHDLVSNPPYHNLDLVVCRNVLIYFAPALQTRVLKHFHSRLKDGGFLLLGKAEAPMGETRALFNCLDIKAKLFRKVGRRK